MYTVDILVQGVYLSWNMFYQYNNKGDMMEIDTQQYKELGNFIKTRRERIHPSQVGISDTSRRRTLGLRREEVAMLAGIGVTWYTWLEQGCHIQISPSVLHSIARVLMLNEYETLHLFELAKLTPEKPLQPIQTLKPIFQHVLDSLVYSPAILLDIYWNVVGWNAAYTAAFVDVSQIDISHRNLIKMMFTHSEYQKRFENWEIKAKEMLARFRVSCAGYSKDPWLRRGIESLREESEEFNTWWPLHEVEPEREITKTIRHPEVGNLFFEHTVFMTPENELRLHIDTPLRHTETEAKLKQLLSR